MIDFEQIQIVLMKISLKPAMDEQFKFYTSSKVPVGTIKQDGAYWQFNSLMAGVSDMTEDDYKTIIRSLKRKFPKGYITGV